MDNVRLHCTLIFVDNNAKSGRIIARVFIFQDSGMPVPARHLPANLRYFAVDYLVLDAIQLSLLILS